MYNNVVNGEIMHLYDKIQTVPKTPGCYQYYDENGTIIYVGKAKNLYNRMRSYFVGSHDAKTTKLVSQIADFQYIITSTETEALILEINLIKKHNPKYNIMLTDDKSYPYICITKEQYPRLIYTRETNKFKGKMYGPYPNSTAAKETAELLNRLYPLRKCRTLPKKECLYYHIGQCLAPCINKIDVSVYNNIENKINNVLKGNVKEEIKSLSILMDEASLRLDYEKAIEYRNLIQYLQVIAEKQKMEGYMLDVDAFGYYTNEDYISIQVFHMREGKMIERRGFLYEQYNDAIEKFQDFIVQFYLIQNNPLPKTILIASGDDELLSDTLKHKVIIPQIGKNLELINLVKANAKQKIDELIQKREIEYQKTQGAFEQLAEILHLDNLHTIEAFDNSNISGASPVSAMVCFVDGKPNRQLYRKFKIKTVVGSNEAATMKEVTYRRYSKVENNPDLIIMDGGAIQVNSCQEVLKSLNRQIPVLGLVKNDNHTTESLLYNDEIIPIDKRSFLFKLLEQIQEEVHRYAISYFHSTHSKNMFISKLDNIKGIGKVKKTQILKLLREDNFQEEIKKLKLTEEQIQIVLSLLDK